MFKKDQVPMRSGLEEEDEMIDPELRLRPVRTAASAIAVSIHNEERANRTRAFLGLGRRDRDFRKATRKRRKSDNGSFFSGPAPSTHGEGGVDELGVATGSGGARGKGTPAAGSKSSSASSAGVGPRREIFVNQPLPFQLLQNGDPTVRYCRNKVSTSKYTILTFLPKNIIFEQFRRVANLYFLLLVILQVFPIFGATTPQIAMLPLVAILGITAVKDGVEDYRRASVDNEVNNSAATKLGDWLNVNQPKDGRTFFERLIGAKNPNERVSKGVRKLRAREAKEGKEIVLTKMAAKEETEVEAGANSYPMSDIHSVASQDQLHEVQDPPDVSFVGRRPRSNSHGSSIAASHAPSALSQGVVDWSRTAPGSARWERTLWKKLEVGDVVLLRDDEQVPADILVLSTADEDGLCYVETKNLDGETNLKPRRALKATSGINSEEDLEHASFSLDVEPPSANLYTFQALLRYSSSDQPGAGATEKLETATINEMLLRGCTIRNSQWIIGLVVFTGQDTKIMLNGGATPSKRSKIEIETNFNVIMNFLILMGLCIVTAIIYSTVEAKGNRSFNSFEVGSRPTDNLVINALVIFVSGLIVFQNIVPISLYISIELVKTIQAFFIYQDREMYYAPLDVTCVPKTWDISDDLGQIEYIFSDKTGTLTQNVMEFKKLSVGGIIYGEGITEAMNGAAKREGREVVDPQEQEIAMSRAKNVMIDRMKRGFKNSYLQEDKVTLISPDVAAHLTDRASPERTPLMDFFRALALCQGVLAEKPDPDNQPFLIDYKAESPDEAALLAAARDTGFPFIRRTNAFIDIAVLGSPERYVPLRVLEFNSTRKRMSVIVRAPDNRIVLYCKGADSVIYGRLRADHDPELRAATQRDLETMANAGLRTLCFGYRYLSEEEYFQWARIHDTASNSLNDRDEEIEKAAEIIEQNLTILGATALEDKLQDGVPATIEILHQAGIKLWVLTGDKVQTAIEIGYSCNLLTNEMDIFLLSAETEAGARLQIEGALNKIASVQGPPAVGDRKISGSGSSSGFAVVIDGDTLRFALESDLKLLFLTLATQCETVICCRVSPAQKAATVRLVKEGMGAMTLSIGDGANDVAIQEAHIGCGLFGHEGSQAAMSADYAFGQFRFLSRLLLVHGHWSYVRISELHANFFWKNLIWTGCLFWYCIFCDWEATYLFEYTFILLFNLIFTSLPVIILGAFDQDVHGDALIAFPALYKRGIEQKEYTRTKFWVYVIDGVYQSAICFFIPYLVYGVGSSWSANGLDTGSIYEFGTTIAASAITAANLFLGMNSKYWTVLTWVTVIGSTALAYIWIVVYSLFATFFFDYEFLILYTTINFWATIVIVNVLAIGPHFLYKAFTESFMPLDKDIIREAWVAGDLKQTLGVSSRRKGRSSRADVDVEDPKSLQSLRPEHHRSGYSDTSIASAEPPEVSYHRTATSPTKASPTTNDDEDSRLPFQFRPSTANPLLYGGSASPMASPSKEDGYPSYAPSSHPLPSLSLDSRAVDLSVDQDHTSPWSDPPVESGGYRGYAV